LQVIGVSLKQIKKFKYLEVVFTTDDERDSRAQDKELDMRMGKASAVT